jgi:hypothetical protein
MANRPGGFALFHTGEVIEFYESSSNYSKFEDNLTELTKDDYCYPEFEQYKAIKETPHCILWSDDYKTELVLPDGSVLSLDCSAILHGLKPVEILEAKNLIPSWSQVSVKTDEADDFVFTFNGEIYI